jgi:hypothetical protein
MRLFTLAKTRRTLRIATWFIIPSFALVQFLRPFADNITLATVLSMAESASESSNTYVVSRGIAIGSIVKLIAARQLHPLRQFGPLEVLGWALLVY